MNWVDSVLMNSQSAGTPRVVLLIMARMSTFIGYSRIPLGVFSRMSRRRQTAVRNALTHLCKLGEIELVEQGGGKAKAGTYRIKLPRTSKLPQLRELPEKYLMP